MTIDRVVVYDFEDGAVGAPFQSKGNYYPDGNYGDLYGGIDGLNVETYVNSVLVDTAPVYASPGYQSTRSLEIAIPDSHPYPSYIWVDNWGYQPDLNPPRLGRVCGMEVTFKVDSSVVRETIVSVELNLNSSSSPALNDVSWSFTSESQFNGGGIWYAGMTGKDTAGNPLGPGTTVFQGDLTDTLHVDLTQWLTAKLLPTGEWSMAYAGGATIMSGQLSPDVRDGGGYLNVGVDTSNRIASGYTPTGTPRGWIDNIVFWINNPDAPVPTFVTDGLSGDLLDTGQRFS